MALSFGTTASNTGFVSGACTIEEQRLGHDVFHHVCRHHIYELVCVKAFTTCFRPSSGLEVQLFKRFKNNWEHLDTSVPRPFELGEMSGPLHEQHEELLLEF